MDGKMHANQAGQDPVPENLSREILELLDQAGQALKQAHAPYSRLHVGAALRSASGRVHTGCNVESAAFPVGGCAEHHAIAAAVRAEGSALRIISIAVLAVDGEGRTPAIPPCGACRQLIHEFGPDATVLFRGRDGAIQSHAIDALLPHSFSLEASRKPE